LAKNSQNKRPLINIYIYALEFLFLLFYFKNFNEEIALEKSDAKQTQEKTQTPPLKPNAVHGSAGAYPCLPGPVLLTHVRQGAAEAERE
jgi:hypothetical protein